MMRRILFLWIGTHAEVCSSSTSSSFLFTCASRYWMRRAKSSRENTRFCSAAESCWTEKISRTNPCRGCRMKLGTMSLNSTSCPDFTESFLHLSTSRVIGTIGAYNVTLFRFSLLDRSFWQYFYTFSFFIISFNLKITLNCINKYTVYRNSICIYQKYFIIN